MPVAACMVLEAATRRHPGLSRRQLAGAVRHRAPARPGSAR
ncbi:hypothetical protein ACU4GD_21270 [Cupriavidus basilensis]